MDNPATQAGKPKPDNQELIRFLTRGELAEALKVSVRTVDRMVAFEEITPVRLLGKLVRFYLPDVVASLKRGKMKFGRRAAPGAEGKR